MTWQPIVVWRGNHEGSLLKARCCLARSTLSFDRSSSWIWAKKCFRRTWISGALTQHWIRIEAWGTIAVRTNDEYEGLRFVAMTSSPWPFLVWVSTSLRSIIKPNKGLVAKTSQQGIARWWCKLRFVMDFLFETYNGLILQGIAHRNLCLYCVFLTNMMGTWSISYIFSSLIPRTRKHVLLPRLSHLVWLGGGGGQNVYMWLKVSFNLTKGPFTMHEEHIANT